jgi:hypothetical protein
MFVGASTASSASEGKDLSTMTVEEILTDPNLSSQTKQSLINHISQMKQQSVTTITKEVTDWNQLGEAFANTLKNIARSLSVEVNEFIKTEVGILVTVLIIYKLLGADIIQFAICTGSWVLLTIFLGIYVRKFHFPVKHVYMKGEEKMIEYKSAYEWDSGEWKCASGVLSVVFFIVYTLVCAINAIPG